MRKEKKSNDNPRVKKEKNCDNLRIKKGRGSIYKEVQ